MAGSHPSVGTAVRKSVQSPQTPWKAPSQPCVPLAANPDGWHVAPRSAIVVHPSEESPRLVYPGDRHASPACSRPATVRTLDRMHASRRETGSRALELERRGEGGGAIGTRPSGSQVANSFVRARHVLSYRRRPKRPDQRECHALSRRVIDRPELGRRPRTVHPAIPGRDRTWFRDGRRGLSGEGGLPPSPGLDPRATQPGRAMQTHWDRAPPGRP